MTDWINMNCMYCIYCMDKRYFALISAPTLYLRIFYIGALLSFSHTSCRWACKTLLGPQKSNITSPIDPLRSEPYLNSLQGTEILCKNLARVKIELILVIMIIDYNVPVRAENIIHT